jgi:hypothetical protein
VPLLEQLGYEEDDFAIGYPVQMYEGVKKVHKDEEEGATQRRAVGSFRIATRDRVR